MRVFIFMTLLFLNILSYGQNIVLNGKVQNENGNSIPNAHITIDGALGEATSDNFGNFVIKLSKTVKKGSSIILRCECKEYKQFAKNIVASDEQLLEIKMVLEGENEAHVDTILNLTKYDNSKTQIEIVISNFTDKDIWLKQIDLSNLVKCHQKGHHPFYYEINYEVSIDSISQVTISDTSVTGNIFAKVFEKPDTTWAYNTIGSFDYVCSSGEKSWDVEIKITSIFKLVKNEKTKVRLSFSNPKKKKIHEKGETGSYYTSSCETSFLVQLKTDKGKIISYVSDNDFLLKQIANSKN